ncbi:phosphodiester glycosidase family protein [Candidatus Gracilibacteria bacterium]|nr:phosphodiester glycosidase family protein [Candidatus Gracilibacteria bacterium]
MYKKGVHFLVIFSIFGVFSASANTLIERKINGYSAKIIEYKTDSKLYDIKIGVHPRDGGTLRSIMGEVGGVTGVNGVFECPKDYPSCGGKNYTINERYVNGEKKGKYKSTGDRVVFGWDKEIKPFLFQTDTINASREGDIFEGFANHPLLLMNGESQTHIYHEKGLINSKMKAKATKNFICSNQSGDTIYFGLLYSIDIDTAAIALKDFGCWNAINLDAGASTTFIYNGKYVLNPQRDILDGVFIAPKNLNVSELDATAKKIMKALLLKINNKTPEQKIAQLQKLNTVLNGLSTSIYSQSTTPVYESVKVYKKVEVDSNEEEEEIGEPEYHLKQVKVGTKIEIKSNSTLKKIYLINLLRTYTAELIKVQEQIERLKYLKKLDLNLKINVEL